MQFKETMLDQHTYYEGVIVNVRQDSVRLNDGSESKREVVEHPGGVAVVALDKDNNVIMVRQYRYPVQAETWELPAGKLERGEEPREAALRELEEETGVVPTDVMSLGETYSSPGIMEERIYLFFAKGLGQVDAHPDEGECLEMRRMPLETVYQMVMDNRIKDSKTVIGILKVWQKLYG